MDERIENSMDAGEAIAQAISEAEDTIAGVKEVTHGMVLSVSGKALGPVAEADAAAGLLNLQQAEDFIAEASDLLEKGADPKLVLVHLQIARAEAMSAGFRLKLAEMR